MISNNHGPAGLVREFHEAFDLGAPHRPVDRVPSNLGYLRKVLHAEEAVEWDCALDELLDSDVVLNEQLVGLVKEACDLAYVAIGTCVALGVDFEAAFREVHASNKSKLGEDGKPVKRKDGKVTKGPNYRPPDPERLIGRRPGELPALREVA